MLFFKEQNKTQSLMLQATNKMLDADFEINNKKKSFHPQVIHILTHSVRALL